jgi:hypothetical protein
MRRAMHVLCAVLLTYFCPPVAAQTVSNVMRPNVPSPTAASLGKFGDVPISYFTGLPQISIPLFTAKGKTLQLPVSLSYHASGIKVEEVGGWVGAGWALEAGGVITRTVRGIVDEQTEGYFKTGYTFYDNTNWTHSPPWALIQNIRDRQAIDPEPDQFFFDFAGQSGEMVGGDTSINETVPNVYVTIPYRKWRIVPTIGSDPVYNMTIISSWVITTENGTKYTFAAPELHVDRTTQWQGTGGRDSKPYVSAWYLTEIRDPGGDVITLQYADYNAEHYTGMYREQANDFYEANPGDCSVPGYVNGSSKLFDMHSQTYVYAKRLTSINSAAHTITFVHSLREDAVSPLLGDHIANRARQEPRLDLITVATPGGVVLRKFEFEYTYQGSLGGRLTLLNVYEEDPSGARLPPYSFTYAGPTLPARATDRTDYYNGPASFALDHWGYYNGATSNNTLQTTVPPGTNTLTGHSFPGADRNPNFNFAIAGSLTRITYPTGGFNEFVYDASDYSAGGPMGPGDSVSYSATAVSSPGDASPHTTDFTVGGTDATVNGTVDVFMSSENCFPGPCVAELWQGSTREAAFAGNRTAVPWTFTRGLTYTLKAWNQGTPNIRVAITTHWYQRLPPPIMRTGAGLRIAEVHASDGMGNVTVRKYRYRLSDGKSSGWLAAEPRYAYTRNVTTGTNQCQYFSRSSAPKNVLGSGPVIGYSLVTESLGVNGVFGQTQRMFAAGCDCAAAAAAGNFNQEWPSLRYTTDAWLRGHQLSAADYSAGGQIQRSVTTTYATPPSPHPLITFRGLAVDVYSIIALGVPFNVVYANPFAVQSSLKVETDQATTVYDTSGASGFTTTTHYTYGNTSHAQLTEVAETNSDGTQRITRFKYPGDYATDGLPGSEAAALAAMQNVSATGAHMPGVVIERSVTRKVGASEKVVAAELTTFKEFLTGQFLPFRHFVLDSPSPIP